MNIACFAPQAIRTPQHFIGSGYGKASIRLHKSALVFCMAAKKSHSILENKEWPQNVYSAAASISYFQKRKDTLLGAFSVLALPIFPGRLQPSIVGRSELNFRVRDGNGWTLALISTNY